MTNPEEKAESRSGPGLPTYPVFLACSIVTAGLVAAIVYGIHALLEKPLPVELLLVCTVAGFAVSTGGWIIVLKGLRDVPERILGYFGAGVLAKLVLLGLVLILVTQLGVATLSDFFMPFAAVFFVTGFVQLGIAIKGATKLLQEAEKGIVRKSPAAPGTAVDPEERG